MEFTYVGVSTVTSVPLTEIAYDAKGISKACPVIVTFTVAPRAPLAGAMESARGTSILIAPPKVCVMVVGKV